MRGGKISTVGDNISTVEGIQYCGGISSVQWGDNISTCGGITSVLWRVFRTVEGYLQYCGGITAVHVGIASVLWRLFSTVGITSVQWGIASVLWRVFSTLGDNISTCGGITSVQWGDNISTVEGIQYSGGYLQYSGG